MSKRTKELETDVLNLFLNEYEFISDIAAQLHCCHKTVRKILRAHGIKTSIRPGNKRKARIARQRSRAKTKKRLTETLTKGKALKTVKRDFYVPEYDPFGTSPNPFEY